MSYYGFRYTDGTNTTTGSPCYIAGQLYRFESKRARDEWVAEGYPVRVPSNVGEFRKAVTSRSLPMGWTVAEAQDVDLDTGGGGEDWHLYESNGQLR